MPESRTRIPERKRPGATPQDRPHLTVRYQPAGGPVHAPEGEHVLATIGYGEHALAAGSGLDVQVPLPQLGPVPVCEQWCTAEAPTLDERHGIRLGRTEELVAGALELPGDELEQSNYDAYSRLLACAAELGVYPARIWNVVPRLHEGPEDLDRYMQFCRGRARAFEDHFGVGFERHLCACSAVGSTEGPQVLYFLATRHPGEHRENPRQVSAYKYPRRYGPRSPSFARATLGPEGLGHPDLAGAQLWVSGTASIVGHESVHLGDVGRQTEETMRNVRVLILGSEEGSLRGRFPLVKTYVRDEGDADAVRRILEAQLGEEHLGLYLRADICRPELLVEIEGLGGEPCQ